VPVTITRVQHVNNAGTSTAPAVTWTNPTTAGNLLIFTLTYNGAPTYTPPGTWVGVQRSATGRAAVNAIWNSPSRSGSESGGTLGVSNRWSMELLEYSISGGTFASGVASPSTAEVATTTAWSSGTTAFAATPDDLVVCSGAMMTATDTLTPNPPNSTNGACVLVDTPSAGGGSHTSWVWDRIGGGLVLGTAITYSSTASNSANTGAALAAFKVTAFGKITNLTAQNAVRRASIY
jgi:hypothetical protein